MSVFRNTVRDKGHYINRVIDSFGKMTDAPKDIHEAYALLHLACACREFNWKINPTITKSDRLNMYFVYFGPSGQARKSTVMGLHRGFLTNAMTVSPFFEGDSFTPQGLRDGLSGREGIPTIIHFDEMEDILIAISRPGSNLGDLPRMLKSLYSSPDMVTKLSAVGKKRNEDTITIRDSFLCLIGNVTPTITNDLPTRYLTDGLIARINIVKASYDVRTPTLAEEYGNGTNTAAAAITVQDELRQLSDHLTGIRHSASRLDANELVVGFSNKALRILSDYQNEVTGIKKKMGDEYEGNSMLARQDDIVISCASLVAAGRLGGDGIVKYRGIEISEQDALDAVRLARKFRTNNEEFIEACGGNLESKNASFLKKSVLREARRTGSLTVSRARLTRIVKNKISSRMFDEAMSALMRSKDIIASVGTDGDVCYSATLPELHSELVPQEADEENLPGAEEPF